MASKSNLSRKVLSVFLAFILLFTQTGFAQVASVELNLSSHFIKLGANFTQNKFQHPHLRYFSYDNLTNNIQLFLDKGDLKNLNDSKLEESSQQLLKYFLIGVTLPDDNFWVNLRPDSENNVISDLLAKTDIGRIFLEADVQLKKDTAQLTSPETAQGKIYWNKLYQKAAQIYGTQNVSIPTLTRPWIVPGEIIIRETQQELSPAGLPAGRQGAAPVTPSAYIYKATLNVLLEQDHLKNSAVYNFEDNRAKELNEYSSQLIRELILPGLTKKVNNDKTYASLRQVYYSLILARWFKARFYGKGGLYASYINKSDLKGLTSQQSWSTSTYFKQYQDSFNKGEYNLKTTINTLGGPSIRSYFSGGISMMPDEMSIIPPNRKTNSSPIMAGFTGRSNITEALTKNFIQLLVTGDGKVSLKTPYLDTPYVNNKKKNGKLLGILSSNNQQLGMRPYLEIDFLPAEFLNYNAQISVYQNFGKNDPEAKPLFTIMTDRKRGLWIQGLNVYQSDFDKLAWEYRTANGYINISYRPYDKSIWISLNFTPSRRAPNEFFQVILEPTSSSPLNEALRGSPLIYNLYLNYALDIFNRKNFYVNIAKTQHELNEKVTKEEIKIALEKIRNACQASFNIKEEGRVGMDGFSVTFSSSSPVNNNPQLQDSQKQLAEYNAALNALLKEKNNRIERVNAVALATMRNPITTIKEIEGEIKERKALLDEKFLEQQKTSSPIFSENGGPETDEKEQKEIDSEFTKINNTILDKKVLDEKLKLLYGYWKNGFKVDLKEVFYAVYIVENRYIAETFEQMGMNVIKHPDSGYAAETVKKIIGELRDYNDTSGADSLAEAARKRGFSINENNIASSPANRVNEENKTGGIDFRSLPMTIQPIGSFRGLNFSLPAASTIAQVNIDKELAEISKMVDTGIMPNGERVKELIAACYHKQELADHQQDLMSCLMRICKLEEEMVVPTGKEIKEALVIIDSIR
jgi:hypothetical protein